MKTTTLLLIFALVGVSFAQDIPTKTVALRGISAGTLFSGKAYADSQSDTSSAISVGGFRDGFVRLTVLDSTGAVTVWYRANVTGTTYMAKVTIGTFAASTVNTGKVEAFALPATALAGKKFQLGVTFDSSGAGTSSATYTLDVFVK